MKTVSVRVLESDLKTFYEVEFLVFEDGYLKSSHTKRMTWNREKYFTVAKTMFDEASSNYDSAGFSVEDGNLVITQ